MFEKKKPQILLERNLFNLFFCLEKQTPEKNEQKKKKKEITRQTQKKIKDN